MTLPTGRNPGRHQLKEDPGSIAWLVAIMRRLLAPDGCPWDREQTLQTLKPYVVEETYEVLDAIDRGDRENHREELGDLLYQIVFQSELARIPFHEVVRGIGDKLIRRHPHVFGDLDVADADEVLVNWEKLKEQEKGKRRSALSGIPNAMPELMRCYELTRKAAKVGFTFPDADAAKAKAMEELEELNQATSSESRDEIQHELGDLLFAIANWARQLDIHPEEALRAANARFETRFTQMENEAVAQGVELKDLALSDLLVRWKKTTTRPPTR